MRDEVGGDWNLIKYELKQRSVDIVNYLRDHEDEYVTLYDIAKAAGLPTLTASGCVTYMASKGLMRRTKKDIAGNTVTVVRLTDEGRNAEICVKEENAD